ncbi:RNA-binding protein [Galdieria sulphuraria]|uniref:RNA-binding protein n=1 Tax=Galdieria sulphuraria TaxID=130081 RepID=M2W330_GALSU|nr:RNA-binding protein [Galdieria sulphuraria]EME30106.1 RNA-binding protein [Galdieria sulphuraria]|eukprot:XP_005706626.1 RNA-binding protein [Galdieria sulphuraria]
MGDLQQGSTIATAESLSHISSNYHAMTQSPSTRLFKDSPCKIFIGQLPSNVVEEDLRRICEPYGTVLETTIVRNRMTNQSRGCGFCVFHNREEADNAIQALHGTKPFPSGSKPLQVRLAEKNSDFSETKLYIGHLEPIVEEQQLRNAFTKFGEIVDVNIVRPRNVDNQHNSPYNYGFVEFSGNEAADNAILSAKNGQVWLENGKPLTEVRYARLSRNRYGRNSDGYYKERGIPEAMLYDPNVALEGWPGMDTNALSSPPMIPSTSYFPPPPFNYFPFSNHVASHVMLDSNGNEVTTPKSSDNEEANSQEGFVNQPNLVNYFPYGMYPSGPALGAMWNPEYGDPKNQYSSTNWFPSMYPYSPEYAEYLAAAAGANAPSFETQQNRVRGPSECNLFVYGIPPDWDDAMLANLFLPFGKLLSSNVFIDKRTQRSKGFGFVSYAYPDSAHMAIAMLNGMTLPNGRTLKVSLKKEKNDNNSE